jgi:hypothetical protein
MPDLDLMQQFRKPQLICRVLDLWETSQISEGVDVPFTDLFADTYQDHQRKDSSDINIESMAKY